MGEQQEKEPTRHVYVSVAEREVFGGWWAAGRKWGPGQHEADLTQKEIDNVAGRKGIVVVDAETGQRYGPAAQALGPGRESLSADERIALADYRRAKARNPDLAQRYAEQEELEPPPKAPAPKPGTQVRGPPPEQTEQLSPPPKSDLAAPPADVPASSAPSSSSSSSAGKGKDKK